MSSASMTESQWDRTAKLRDNDPHLARLAPAFRRAAVDEDVTGMPMCTWVSPFPEW